MRLLKQRSMKVLMYESRESMGWAAAVTATKIFEKLLQKYNEVNVVFAAAPSQDEFLDALSKVKDEKLVTRYEELLKEYPLHLACIGIGENGHIAFNEPSVADFNDPHLVKIVKLDEKSRQQQVNDGCFEHIVCVVPGERKKEAVFKTLEGPVTTECPASVLRRHPSVNIFLDKKSASLISGEE